MIQSEAGQLVPSPAVVVDQVTIAYGIGDEASEAVHDVSFRIEPGSTLALVGPSGCGKTSLLKAVLGEIRPRSGGVVVEADASHTLRTGAVFQDAPVFPWMTALGNVEFTLRLAGRSRPEAREEAMDWLERVGLQGFESHYPRQLSGGMRQRVALARALAVRPSILVLDEPFGQLDLITRANLNLLLAELSGDGGPTTLLVTHSIEEAVFLADRVVVLSPRPGRIVASLSINLGWPRSDSLRYTPKFVALCREISIYLGQEGPDAFPGQPGALVPPGGAQ